MQTFYTLLLVIATSIFVGCDSGKAKSAKNSPAVTASQSKELLDRLIVDEFVPLQDLTRQGLQTTLPEIQIDTLLYQIANEPKIQAWMTVIEPQVDGSELISYRSYIGIEYRGSSSQAFFPKKSFGVETRDADGNDRKVDLLGMPAESDWVFYGPYSDKTLARNGLAFELATAFDRYASRWQYFTLVLNGEQQGTYLLLEKIKRDKNRVDIAKLTADDNDGEDLTGGYILKIDKSDGEDKENPSAFNTYKPYMGFISKHIYDANLPVPRFINGTMVMPPSHFFLYHYPQPEKITGAQKAYIQTYIANFEATMESDNFADPTSGYAQFIEVNSFVDYLLHTELTHNIDGYRLSSFLYKDKNGKLIAGPFWDFNLAFANANYCDGERFDTWIFAGPSANLVRSGQCDPLAFPLPFWWPKLMTDPAFVSRVNIRWFELRTTIWSDEQIEQTLQKVLDQAAITNIRANNFAIWPVLGEYIWPNAYVGSTYEEEVFYLTAWLKNRLAWMDTNLPLILAK